MYLVEPVICFYKVEDDDKYGIGDDAVLHVKIDKASTATKKKISNLALSVIKYFDHQGPKIIRVLCNMMIMVFEHLGTTTCKGIYQR